MVILHLRFLLKYLKTARNENKQNLPGILAKIIEFMQNPHKIRQDPLDAPGVRDLRKLQEEFAQKRVQLSETQDSRANAQFTRNTGSRNARR